uniref:Uncharacterized protein n=1 Tax=Aegilops tauschii TaxID=37682 RepID=M8BPI0_AEGTA
MVMAFPVAKGIGSHGQWKKWAWTLRLELLTILLSFGTSALGIAYGTLSASWDPEKEGSLLGVDEARTNWPELWKEEIDKDNK